MHTFYFSGIKTSTLHQQLICLELLASRNIFPEIVALSVQIIYPIQPK